MKNQPKPRRLPSIFPPGPGFPPSFLPDPNFPVFFFFHPIQTSLLIQPNQSLLKSPSFFNMTQTSVLLSIRPRSLSFLPLDPNLPRFSFFFFCSAANVAWKRLRFFRYKKYLYFYFGANGCHCKKQKICTVPRDHKMNS